MKFSIGARILIGVTVFGTLGLLILFSFINGDNTDDENTVEHNINNVYLYEEVEFADEAYFRCIGINAAQEEDTYTLNLFLDVEQWNTDGNINQFELTPDMFELRLSNIDSKSGMNVFMNSLINATLSASASIVLGGEFNVIEETVGFASNYVEGSIENSSSDDSIAIKALTDSFEPYSPYEFMGETRIIKVSFEVTQEFLSSSKAMVLAIDEGFMTLEQNMFLVLRPNTEDYTVHFDLNGGVSDEVIEPVDASSGTLVELPMIESQLEGYRFLCWTSEINDVSTKIRNIYFPTYDENETFTVYAYYLPLVPDDEVISINESVFMREDNYEITVTEVNYLHLIAIKNQDLLEVELTSPEGYKYIAVSIIINKLIEGDNHTLDNSNDFYLENDHSSLNLEGYFGYIKTFESIKPVDDYTWINVELKETGIYEFTMYFLVPENLMLEGNMLFLEIDFFIGINSKSILLQ